MTITKDELKEIIGTPVISQNLITGEVVFHNKKEVHQEPSQSFVDVFSPPRI